MKFWCQENPFFSLPRQSNHPQPVLCFSPPPLPPSVPQCAHQDEAEDCPPFSIAQVRKRVLALRDWRVAFEMLNKASMKWDLRQVLLWFPFFCECSVCVQYVACLHSTSLSQILIVPLFLKWSLFPARWNLMSSRRGVRSAQTTDYQHCLRKTCL